MARRVILDTQYTFTPSTRTIVIPRIIPRERILLITNVTTNTVIYNFSDPTLTFTSFSTAGSSDINTNATTTVVLAYNTTSMSSTDKIQIVVDEPAELFAPDETYLDPVGKFRVSQPQALIDTDFEYGLQPTKWEALGLINMRPSFFVNTQNPFTVSNMTVTNGQSNVNIVISSGTIPANGTPITVQDSLFREGNGNFVVDSNTSATSFSYTARTPFTGTTGSVFNSTLTQVYQGAFYANAAIAFTTIANASPTSNNITVNTTIPHGLYLGNGIYVTNTNSSNVNGSWTVTTVANSTNFQFVTTNAPNTNLLTTGVSIYNRPETTNIHRAFDGGVQFSTGTTSHTSQTVRQTRRYFRYQSGKGIQISTGTILKPNLNIDELAVNGSVIVVTTKNPHYLSGNVSINISGANESQYNGNNVVETVLNGYQFTYRPASLPSNTVATGLPSVYVNNWYGSGTRLGMFDFQNGFYFEYDGQQAYVVRRRSTDQIAGFVNLTNGSSYVTGASVNNVTTKFSKQLIPGDFIVIRGMPYRVQHILSDTSMQINPPYRGPSLTGTNVAVVTKTTEIRIPQSQWNIDKMDGTGPSGHILDLSKMQMFYIDYSWYGAGPVRFGFRDSQGKIIYVHRIVNNNLNSEAYMRSGNLPARYETHTYPPATTLNSSVGLSDTTIFVANTSLFPSSGTLKIENPVSYEFVAYTGKTANSFTGLTRGKATTSVASVTQTANSANLTTASSVSGLQVGMFAAAPGLPNPVYISQIGVGGTSNIQLTAAATTTATQVVNFYAMGNPANTHTVTNTAPILVSLHAPSFAPTISHWGTSVIMDGRFDDDKSLVFTYGEPALTTVTPGNTVPLMSIRVAPSVDSGITGFLGQKDTINRMQLKLVGLGVLAQGQFLMSAILNGTVSNTGQATAFTNTFTSVAQGTSSLAQIADHSGNCAISGGESVISFYAVNSAGATNFSVQTQDLDNIRDLGNSILGGGLNNNVGSGFYPDGPDVITITARNIGTVSANVQVRLSWTEAQA